MNEHRLKTREKLQALLSTSGWGPDRAPEGENDYLHCGLFGDAVPEEVCDLRRAELNERGDFSCEGCLVDMVLTMHRETEFSSRPN